MSEEAKPQTKAKAVPKAKAEVEKQPTPEELPFEEFVTTHYMPALTEAFKKVGIADLELKFDNSQLQGFWKNRLRQFTVYFSKQDISGHKAFSCADAGFSPSTIEPFLIDERKATLDLLVFGVMQRLNGQKWLKAN